ncbi:MAG: RnfABCDGE type electron transport complex subunit D [Candidatus Brocadiia bacterium]
MSSSPDEQAVAGQDRLLVSISPHLRAPEGISGIMWNVVAALVPAVAVSIYFFGLDAVRVYVISIAAAEATELVCLRLRGRPLAHAADGSAFVTGLLLAMVIPASVASYVPAVGAVFAVAIAKHAFGGLGNNIWNPALASRVFLQFAYAQQISLSAWPVPRALWGRAADAVTQASPLADATVRGAYGYLDLLFGNGVPGCIGETSKIVLLVGGLYLIARNIVDWRIPVAYIGTVFLLTWVLPVPEGAPGWAGDPLYHVLSGGLMIGALFMATDMVTTPVTPRGRAVFGIGCGVVVALVRRYGGYPEGVAYSIVLMNTCTPLIDRWLRPRIYGSRTAKPATRAA